jgi:NOL1/NOP2/fmu family ribosome biogenesis protein
MFRKDPAAINEWSENVVDLCSQRQKRILADVYPALKQNGILIYSTCSYSKQENEEISDWLCEEFDVESIPIPLKTEWGILETLSDQHKCFGYRFYPHKVKGEGFFIAAFRKNELTANPHIKRAKENSVNQKSEDLIRRWIKHTEDIKIVNLNDEYFVIPAAHEADLQYLQSNLYLKKSGVRIGKIMGKDLVPNHELAISLIVGSELPKLNLTREQSISYLKRDELRIQTDIRGWAMMCFEGHPLGWAKILDNRLNNYFPKEIRITNPNVV